MVSDIGLRDMEDKQRMWMSNPGYVIMESGKLMNRHGVAIIVNSKWRNKINWLECASERVVATSNSDNKKPITFGKNMPHSGYPDHHVERAYETIRRAIDKDRNMKIIGGDFNAEMGAGIGIEQASVGHYDPSESNKKGPTNSTRRLQEKLVKE